MMILLRGIRGTVKDYVALTKPPIVVLLLVTTLAGMILGEGGIPSISLLCMVMIGGALAAGGASSINHWFDRDIDKLMLRTRKRPIPANRTTPKQAFIFGVVLNIIALGIFAIGVNYLSALLTLIGSLIYILVYTIWLKRSTPQNIVIGGAAGAMPPLIGWAAVTGGIGLPAIYLFAIVFFWTPPHFWALSLLMKDDYERAGVPMLSVVRGTAETKRSIFLYTLILVALSLLFFVVPGVDWFYFTLAAFLGAYFIYMSWRLMMSEDIHLAKHLYLYSLLYLFVLFAGIMIDAIWL